MAMTKQQRLRNTAEGLMAGLVECGFHGPAHWNNLDWELPFITAWGDWAPNLVRRRTSRRSKSVATGRHQNLGSCCGS